MLSQRGKDIKVINGYKLRFYRHLSNNIDKWVCTKKNCTAYLKYNEDILIEENLNHNHDSDSYNTLERQKLTNNLKRKAIEDICQRPSKMIHTEVLKEKSENISTDDVTRMRKCIHHARMKVHPKLPKTLEALQESVPSFLEKKNWMYINDKNSNILSLTTEQNLNFMKECDTLYMDGTFSSVPVFFKQLFTIHGFKNGLYVPVFFSLLPSKTSASYRTAFLHLNELCEIEPVQVYIDFESAIHLAAKSVWPDIKIKGCRFHLGQAWYRKMQSLGLATLYQSKNSEISSFLKMFFGLPFFAPNEVEDCFAEDIMSIQPSENSAVVKFCDYVLDNYIDVDSNFPPHIWAEFSCNISRTTNACESFHSKLNSMFYHPHPNIYKLVEALGEVQTMSNIKIKSTQRKIRRSKATTDKEKFVTDKIQEYKQKKIDRPTFVKALSCKFSAKL